LTQTGTKILGGSDWAFETYGKVAHRQIAARMKTHATNVQKIDEAARGIRRFSLETSAHPRREARKHVIVAMIVRACIAGTSLGTLNVVPAVTLPYES